MVCNLIQMVSVDCSVWAELNQQDVQLPHLVLSFCRIRYSSYQRNKYGLSTTRKAKGKRETSFPRKQNHIYIKHIYIYNIYIYKSHNTCIVIKMLEWILTMCGSRKDWNEIKYYNSLIFSCLNLYMNALRSSFSHWLN